MAGLWDCRKVRKYFNDTTCCHRLTLFWTEISLGLISDIIQASAIASATCLAWSAKTVDMEETPLAPSLKIADDQGALFERIHGKIVQLQDPIERAAQSCRRLGARKRCARQMGEFIES